MDVAVDLDKNKLEQYGDRIINWIVDKCFDLFIAIIFIVVGLKLCKLIVNLIKKSFKRSGMENSVAGFLISVIRGVLYAVVFIMAASLLGFQVTSLVAILGTASLSIGLALQGSLANFAGGVLILIMKPFKVGDYIIENDKNCEGTVEAIDIFYTKLVTYDNKHIVIPNGNITANSIVNVTAEKIRRLDIYVGVAYDSDLVKVKRILGNIVKESKYYDSSKDIDIFVDSLEDSSVKMGLRCFVHSTDYWNAKWEINENIVCKFREEGIEIPFNQMEITVKNQTDI